MENITNLLQDFITNEYILDVYNKDEEIARDEFDKSFKMNLVHRLNELKNIQKPKTEHWFNLDDFGYINYQVSDYGNVKYMGKDVKLFIADNGEVCFYSFSNKTSQKRKIIRLKSIINNIAIYLTNIFYEPIIPCKIDVNYDGIIGYYISNDGKLFDAFNNEVKPLWYIPCAKVFKFITLGGKSKFISFDKLYYNTFNSYRNYLYDLANLL